MTADSVSRFFVKKDALTYTPPAGVGHKIHAVVRLAQSLDGSKGKEVAGAFREGMVQSDIAYYSGHGRYGSGPDFDRNFRFNLLAADKKTIEQSINHYEILEHELKHEGAKAGRGAWAQFEWRVAQGRIDVIGSNEGNVFLNDKNPHGEFGSKLMYWNLSRSGGKGAPLLTGKGGGLASDAAAHPERKYRVVVFDGCRSVDYNKALRATPGFGTGAMDEFGSNQELFWGEEGRTLAAFLDSILAMQSGEEIAKRLDKEQIEVKVHPAYQGFGLGDNPVTK